MADLDVTNMNEAPALTTVVRVSAGVGGFTVQ